MSAERITDPEERREQLTRAPKADEHDADERIELSEGKGGATRIDIVEDPVVRPGGGHDD